MRLIPVSDEPDIYQRIEITSADARERPFVFSCSKRPCVWSTSAADIESALRTKDTHSCPHYTPTKVAYMHHTLSLTQKIWLEMDGLYDKLMSIDEKSDMAYMATRAQIIGMASVAKYWMPPALNDEKLIMRELVLRGALRKEGKPLNTEGVEYPWRPDGTQDFTTHENRTGVSRTAAVPAEIVVPEEIKTKIINAAGFGLEPADIAKSYNVPLPQVNSIINAAK